MKRNRMGGGMMSGNIQWPQSRHCLNKNGESFFLAVGYCQAPFIRNESIVEVRAIPFPEIYPGDLVVYCGNKAPICHRVIFRRCREEVYWYLTKPDNSLADDGWIPAYRIMGKVIAVNRLSMQTRRAKRIDGLLLARSRFQWLVLHYFFCSVIGVRFRRLRKRYLSDAAFLSEFFFKLTSPWLWRKSMH